LVDYETFLKPLNRFKSLGEKKSDNNSRLIGNPDKSKPFYWLIKIFFPLGEKELSNLTDEINIPNEYKNFLLNCCNGLDLFLGTLSLFGYRENMNRTFKDVIQQPFNILTVNLKEKPKNSKDEYFYIGSYNWDGSLLYINIKDHSVHLCKSNDATSVHSWESFETFLSMEVNRICSLMKDDGTEIDSEKSLLPS